MTESGKNRLLLLGSLTLLLGVLFHLLADSRSVLVPQPQTARESAPREHECAYGSHSLAMTPTEKIPFEHNSQPVLQMNPLPARALIPQGVFHPPIQL